ncbi:MAG: SatD family protein [Actinobacteria bacterium]|nr:SatD family protein [Actinomycetota bacterium]
MNKNTYAVIIGDIIGSADAADRAELQRTFEKKIEEVNLPYSEHLAVKFQITLGDEFQGLVKDLKHLPAIVSGLREIFHPIRIRLSIGIGLISTDIKKQIGLIDGPAFNMAREGIGEISKSKDRVTIYKTGNEEIDNTLNIICSLTDILIRKRTKEQWEAVRLYRREQNLKRVADILNVKFQNIHKRLQSTHWSTYEKTENFLSNYITSKFSP